ncbi:MAG: hypothetical protein ACO3DQ_09420 [Cephaloticoccus sp.]
MRLAAVSVVKNEADIIEAFVRHTAAWVDLHLIRMIEWLAGQGVEFIEQPMAKAELDATAWLRERSPLPLVADDFFDGPGRPDLESALSASIATTPYNLPLHDYCVTRADLADELNPVLRLRHCRPTRSSTRKLIIPRALATDPAVSAGKGNHTLFRDTSEIPALPMPEAWRLGPFALRSGPHHLIRLVRSELQRLARGRAGLGLDVHYRLGYQLLAEEPELFFASLDQSPAGMSESPLPYRGGELRHTPPTDWSRVARSLFPYLEQLARSYGELADLTGRDVASTPSSDLRVHELPLSKSAVRARETEPFIGFTPVNGWGPKEGPVPEAFLPAFHWAMAPVTELVVDGAATGGAAGLNADCLTYNDGQRITVELNGQTLHQLTFSQVNHREALDVPLQLVPGKNRLRLHFSHSLATERDPRQLAVISLSLRIRPVS